MDISDTLLGKEWYWAAWLVWIPVFAHSLFKAPWSRLKSAEQLNLWLGMIVLLTLIWSMKAGVKPGLSLHLLGASIFSLCFGPYLAFIGLSATTLGTMLNGASGSFAFALNSLLLAGLGVLVSQLFYRIFLKILPRHFFVYIFIQAFLASGLVVVVVGLLLSIFLAMAGAYTWEYLFDEYYPYFALLGFSEAWLSGMVMTVFIVYRPDWVITFDDSHYLNGK